MKFNQTLSKDSLTKLKTFFYEKSKQKRKPVLGGEQSIKWLCIAIIILYVTTVLIYCLEHEITSFTKTTFWIALSGTIYVLFLVWFKSWNRERIGKRIDKTYKTQFSFEFLNDYLVYKNIRYDYKEIDCIIFYDEFILIDMNNRILVMYREEELIPLILKLVG